MKAITAIALALTVSLFSAAGQADKEIDAKDFSGWMDNYDSLVFSEERNAFVFFNKEKLGTYQKLMVDSVEIFSEDSKADPQVAAKASEYLEAGCRKIAEDKGILATEAGPGVARYKLAITGVSKTKEGLKAYHIVPVSAVFRGAQAASGNVPTYIDAMFEAEMVDSVSGERIAAIVRKGIAETDKRSGDSFRFEDVQPTLDAWLAAWSETVDTIIARKAAQ